MLALRLAAIGIYRLMSYVVSERTREVGIRMALERWRLLVGLVYGGGEFDGIACWRRGSAGSGRVVGVLSASEMGFESGSDD